LLRASSFFRFSFRRSAESFEENKTTALRSEDKSLREVFF